MRYTDFFLPTLKEDPADAEVVSHRLMTRAGMIRKLASGIYSYLPLGLRVIRRVEQIIREEMNAAGAHEVLMPSVQPKELWQETGRWQYYGKELLRFTDRAGRDFCYGPTHEEVITDLVRNNIRSYRDLPLNLYQIQTKFRDEIRPRFGVMRSREFIMKDGYSFDRDEEGAERTYGRMKDAYSRIFERCGLDFRAVEADTGTIGGSFSHEFMVMADTGEDTIFICDSCSYAANRERAEIGDLAAGNETGEAELSFQKVATPDKKSIDDVAAFLNVPKTRIAKTLVYLADSTLHMVIVRGDRNGNEIKVKNILGATEIRPATNDEIETMLSLPVGYMGPWGRHDIRVIADNSLKKVNNFVTGANESGFHIVNANFGRDIEPVKFADLAEAEDGDPCPRCAKGKLYSRKGIEVGHIFKLGTKYSSAMNAVYLDEKGGDRPMVMGCYGIGVGRTVAAAIEQNHDKDGIIFPAPLSPFQAVVVPTNVSDGEIRGVSDDVYQMLGKAGVETLVDDRDERPGVKFKDADLMGIPCRVTIGNSFKNEGKVEVTNRKDKSRTLVSPGDVVDHVRRLLSSDGV